MIISNQQFVGDSESAPRKPRLSRAAPDDVETEIYQAKNFLMAIFVGSDAETVVTNAAIERRLGYYIFEIYAAVNADKGSLRYAPFRFAAASAEPPRAEPAPTSAAVTARKPFYPSPLEVRKFLLLRQISLFPWPFPLSRITLPTHVGVHLVGATAKQETAQLFFLLPQRDSDHFLRAMETAFPRRFCDFLALPPPAGDPSAPPPPPAPPATASSSSAASSAAELRRQQQRHSWAAPLWQQDAVKVSFFHVRTSAWSAWQRCALRLQRHYDAQPDASGLRWVSSLGVTAPAQREPAQQELDPAEASAYGGKEQRFFLRSVSLSLADVAAAQRTRKRKPPPPRVSRRLFSEDDGDDDDADSAAADSDDVADERAVLRVRCQQLRPTAPARLLSAAGDAVCVAGLSEAEREAVFDDVQLHVELPHREMALEFALACAQLSHDNADGLLDFAQQLLRLLQEESARFARYKILGEDGEAVLRRFVRLREQAEDEVSVALSPAKGAAPGGRSHLLFPPAAEGRHLGDHEAVL